MEQWEYRVIRPNRKLWPDSDWRQGELKLMKLPQEGDWYNPGPIFSALGAEGWELVVGGGELGAGDVGWHGAAYVFKRRRIA